MRSIPYRSTSDNRQAPSDLIRGMILDIATARHTAVRDGQTYYFCCPACKKTFDKQAG